MSMKRRRRYRLQRVFQCRNCSRTCIDEGLGPRVKRLCGRRRCAMKTQSWYQRRLEEDRREQERDCSMRLASNRQHTESKRAAVIRALEADWLIIPEIAEELDVPLSFVRDVSAAVQTRRRRLTAVDGAVYHVVQRR